MLATQSDVEQHIKQYGAKQLTALDNTGLYCNSNHYSKKTKQIVMKQTAHWARKGRSVGHGRKIFVRANQGVDA